MSNEQLGLFIKIALGLFAGIVVAYYFLTKVMNKKNTKYNASLVEGTRNTKYSMEIFYQKAYITYVQFPFLRRYVLKLRRRLEIINLEDEYVARK